MAFFSKKIKVDQKQDLLNLLDSLYEKSNHIKLVQISKEIKEVRKLIISNSINKNRYQEINSYLKKINNIDFENNQSLVSKVLLEITNLILNSNINSGHQQKNILDNQEKVAKLSDEINRLQHEITDADRKIAESLKTNQKNQWMIHNQRKKAALQKTSLLQQDLEKVIIKNSTIDVSLQVSESSKLTEELKKQKNSVDLGDLALKLEDNKANSDEIIEENAELDQLIGNSILDENSFERAREEYLLEKSTNEELTIENKDKETY